MPLDLDAGTAAVVRDIMAPQAGDPPSMPRPLPRTLPGGESPIKHIFLIVRENKTFDFLLGGLTWRCRRGKCHRRHSRRLPGLRRGQCAITTNIRRSGEAIRLFRELLCKLRSIHAGPRLADRVVRERLCRTGLPRRERQFARELRLRQRVGLAPGEPGFGNFFTHLLKNQRSFTIYGEVVRPSSATTATTSCSAHRYGIRLLRPHEDRHGPGRVPEHHLFDAGTPPPTSSTSRSRATTPWARRGRADARGDDRRERRGHGQDRRDVQPFTFLE